MADTDPGYITRISCQHQMGGGSLAIAALVNGRALVTYVDPGTSRAYPNDNAGSIRLTPRGFDDLSSRLGLPAGLNALDLVGVESISDLHLVTGAAGGARMHAVTHKPVTANWSAAASIDAAFDGASDITSTALASGAGHLQVLQTTSDGRLVMSARQSASQTWTNYRSYGPETLGGNSFGHVVTAEEVLIPFAPDVALWDLDPDYLSFFWYDTDDFEAGYRILSGSTVVASPPALIGPDLRYLGSHRVARNDLESGRGYRFEMVAHAAAGQSYRYEVAGPVGRLVTQARPTLGTLQHWETNGFGCFACDHHFHFLYGYEDNSVGRAELKSTRHVQLKGLRNDGMQWQSPLMAPAIPDGFYRMGYQEFIGSIGGDFTRWSFWFETVGFDGRRLASRAGTFPNFDLHNDRLQPGPAPPPPLNETPPLPPCCFVKVREFGED